MLALTRKVGEAIIIGTAIVVKVVEIKGGQVRLGIEAPQDMRIFREELLTRVRQENRQAQQWQLEEFNHASARFAQKEPK